MLSIANGTNTNASNSGDSRTDRRRRAVLVTGMTAVTSTLEDLLGGSLPFGEDRVDLVRLVDELGQRRVRGGLQRVAGVTVEELGEFGGSGQHRLALGVGRQDDSGAVGDVGLLRLCGGRIGEQRFCGGRVARLGTGEEAVGG